MLDEPLAELARDGVINPLGVRRTVEVAQVPLSVAAQQREDVAAHRGTPRRGLSMGQR
ncbi:MAG: hypothetical protein ACRDUV_17230 [Pseudonocardiaceae bacterium]